MKRATAVALAVAHRDFGDLCADELARRGHPVCRRCATPLDSDGDQRYCSPAHRLKDEELRSQVAELERAT